jgi:hypothetical protein
MTIYEQRKQHLDSRLAVYLNDPKQRAGSGSYCKYRTTDGKKCFIGQDIPDEKYNSDIEGYGLSDITGIAELLPEKIRYLGISFLGDCQSLHDKAKFWDDKGLTDHGKHQYKLIVEKHCTAP